MKKLSIITINYNHAEGLEKTLKSIFNSNLSCDEYESIIIDGGSTDASVSVIRQFESKITYWISEKDKGIFDAMNKGVIQVRGEYVIFMNSGDTFHESFLGKTNIENLKGDLVYGDFYTIDDKKNKKYVKQTDNLDFFYFLGKTLCHQTIFLKSSLLKNYPFSLKYKLNGDWIQLFEIFKNENITVKKLNLPVCYYDTTGLSSSQNEKRLSERKSYLLTQYSGWEYESLNKMSRMRGRVWFPLVMKALDKIIPHKTLTYISKFF